MTRLILIILMGITSTGISYSQIVSLWAGTAQTSGYTSGLDKLSSKFDKPYGIAQDTNGYIWISESNGHVIKAIDPFSGKSYARAGAYGQAGFYNSSGIAAKFNSPMGIAIGPSNEIYVADKDNHVIRKISPLTSLSNAQSVTVFAGKYSASGQNYTSYPGYADGNANSAQFLNPTDVAVDDAGNVYVADMGNHVIRKITPAGYVSTIAGQAGQAGFVNGSATSAAKFNNPVGVYYDSGYLYVADLGNSAIRKIDLTNKTVSTLVSGLWTPYDIVKIGSDYLISDQHRIRLYNGSSVSTYAGADMLNVYGYKNGSDTSARFYDVRGILAQGSHILVADMSNHVIRKVTVCQSYTPAITITGNTTFCQGDSVILTGPSGYSRYLWSTGDTTQSIIVKTSKSVYLTVKNADSCTGTSQTIQITVNPKPSSSFTLDGHACTGDDDTIRYTGSTISGANYFWDFDGAVILSGVDQGPYVVQWDTAGIKQVSLYVEANGCFSDTTVQTMTVDSTPTALFTLASPVCDNEPDTIVYTGTASSSANYIWDLDRAQIISGSGQGPLVVKWLTSGNKTVTLTVKENGCTSPPYSQIVTVNRRPLAFILSDTAGCQNNTFQITYKGLPTSQTIFHWYFDSGQVQSGSGSGPYNIYWNKPGYKNVWLVVEENNCFSDTASKIIHVKNVPVASFTTPSSVCTDLPDSIVFTGQATTGKATFYWDFDGGTIAAGTGAGPYLVSWSTSGTKTIKLVIEEDGCFSDTFSMDKNIKQGPTPYFQVKSKLCQGEYDTIVYTGNASASAQYTWDFAGANIISGSGQGPYILYWGTGGKKDVSLQVSENGCTSKTQIVSVNVVFMPLSYFELDTSVCKNEIDSIKFTGYASSQATFNWDFSGAFIQSGSGSGPYAVKWGGTGAKTVSLVIEDQGCVSTKTEKIVNVYDLPKKPNIILLSDHLYSTAASGNQWYDSNGMILGADSREFYPSKNGWYYVKVTNKFGCSTRSDWVYFYSTDIEEADAPFCRIYPNPFQDKIIIYRADNFNEPFEFSIINPEGKSIYHGIVNQPYSEWSLPWIGQGVYYLRITSKDYRAIYKIIKI